MRIDKIILKAVFSTLLAIFLLCGLTVTVLVFVYPSTMMNFSYNLGWDHASAWFADRSYEQFGKTYYIAYATEVAIGTDDAKIIERYGTKMISDKNFNDYCAEIDKNTSNENISGLYSQYIYGNVCIAKYELGKKEESVELAFSVNKTSFTKNNAVVAILLTSVNKKTGDKNVASTIINKLKALQVEQNENKTFTDIEIQYINDLIEFAQSRTGS